MSVIQFNPIAAPDFDTVAKLYELSNKNAQNAIDSFKTGIGDANKIIKDKNYAEIRNFVNSLSKEELQTNPELVNDFVNQVSKTSTVGIDPLAINTYKDNRIDVLNKRTLDQQILDDNARKLIQFERQAKEKQQEAAINNAGFDLYAYQSILGSKKNALQFTQNPRERLKLTQEIAQITGERDKLLSGFNYADKFKVYSGAKDAEREQQNSNLKYLTDQQKYLNDVFTGRKTEAQTDKTVAETYNLLSPKRDSSSSNNPKLANGSTLNDANKALESLGWVKPFKTNNNGNVVIDKISTKNNLVTDLETIKSQIYGNPNESFNEWYSKNIKSPSENTKDLLTEISSLKVKEGNKTRLLNESEKKDLILAVNNGVLNVNNEWYEWGSSTREKKITDFLNQEQDRKRQQYESVVTENLNRKFNALSSYVGFTSSADLLTHIGADKDSNLKKLLPAHMVASLSYNNIRDAANASKSENKASGKKETSEVSPLLQPKDVRSDMQIMNEEGFGRAGAWIKGLFK